MKAKRRRVAMAHPGRLAPFCLCGAQTSLAYLQALLDETDGVRQGDDPECLHRMRVAARRLRSIVPLYTVCVPRRACARWCQQVRRLLRALGTARDVDVQLACVSQLRATGAAEGEQAGLERLQLRLQQQRQALQPSLHKALRRFTKSKVSTEMARTLQRVIDANQHDNVDRPGCRVYRHMRRAIRRRLEKLAQYAPYVQQPDCCTALHDMRIAAKRLRYTMQAFVPFYQERLDEAVQSARRLQDLLGEVHDCDVWAAQLPVFLEDEQARTEAYFGDSAAFTRLLPGILALQKNRAQYRTQRYQDFVAFWHHSQEHGVWERLRETLDAPL